MNSLLLFFNQLLKQSLINIEHFYSLNNKQAFFFQAAKVRDDNCNGKKNSS